jgi:hypothetical protein
VVDWNVDDFDQPASVCTVGYTTTSFTTPDNGGFVNVATHGIGINDSGQLCSVRAFNSSPANGIDAGSAATSNDTTTAVVELWFEQAAHPGAVR